MRIKYPSVSDGGDLILSPPLTIPFEDLDVRATTAQGPGGQHVNRTLSKIVVTFSVRNSVTLSPSDREWLISKVGPVIKTSASRFRSQKQNREAALNQLASRLAEALIRPNLRRATKPTKASKTKRLDAKRSRGEVKRLRRSFED